MKASLGEALRSIATTPIERPTTMLEVAMRNLGKGFRKGERFSIWPLNTGLSLSGGYKDYMRERSPYGEITSEPSLELDMMAQIKGNPHYAKEVAKSRRIEVRSRGLRTGSLVDDKTRGAMYHGGKTIPEQTVPRADFRLKRGGKLNLGEPTGISLSRDPHVAGSERFAERLPADQKRYEGLQKAFREAERNLHRKAQGYFEKSFDAKEGSKEFLELRGRNKKTLKLEEALNKARMKLEERYPRSFARVLPVFGDQADKVILDATKPAHGEIFKDAYTVALRQVTEPWGWKPPNYESFRSNIKWHEKQWFNDILTSHLQSQGWKGVLYSPHRFNEYELKFFDPQEVLMLDRRTTTDPGLKRQENKRQEYLEDWSKETQGKPVHLSDWYEEIDFSEVFPKEPKK